MNVKTTLLANKGSGNNTTSLGADMLKVSLFGGLSVQYNEVQLRLGKKQGALLACLVLTHGGKVNRDRVLGMLWSNHPVSKARGNLRQVLKNLRDQLEAAGFSKLETLDGSQLFLPPNYVDLDVNAALASVSCHDPSAFLLDQKSIHEILLLDFEDIDPEYDNWILLQRHAIRERLSLHLESALSSCSSGQIRKLAMALRNLDPSNEVAARALMRHHADENNFSSALRVYKEIKLLLDDEYGMDPTAETENLAVEIKLGESDPTSFKASGPHVDSVISTEAVPELVVESFNTEFMPEDQVYVVNGFRHDLLASLARFRDWRVVEESLQVDSDFAHKKKVRRYLVRTQTYIDDAVLQLVFTLIDVSTASIFWSQRYALRMESWLVTQTQIIRKLAVSLNINISAERLNAIWRNRELPAALHDQWLLGQSHVFQWSPESSEIAERIFQSLTVDASNFAPAYSGLVQIENSRHLVFPGVSRKRPGDQSTTVLARKAVQIDPLDSRAHLSMAWSLSLSGRFEEALRYFDSASELNENDPWTIVSTAQGYSFCAEYDRAKQLVEEANDLGLSFNPLHCAYQVGTKFLYGDYQGSIESAESAGDIISNVRAWKAAALANLGLIDSAVEEGHKFLAINRLNWHGDDADPTDEVIVEWLLHCFPIRGVDRWNMFRDGLAKAKLPIPTTGSSIYLHTYPHCVTVKSANRTNRNASS